VILFSFFFFYINPAFEREQELSLIYDTLLHITGRYSTAHLNMNPVLKGTGKPLYFTELDPTQQLLAEHNKTLPGIEHESYFL